MSEQAEEDKSRIVEANERRVSLAADAEIAALRARVEALEAFVQDLADENCRNQEACGETNLRLIDYCGPCRARALLEKEKKP